MLKVETLDSGRHGIETKKVSGFSKRELDELKSMTNQEAEEKLIEMLDSRNGNQGTCWACGYGIYAVWFDEEAAYLNVGNTCD